MPLDRFQIGALLFGLVLGAACSARGSTDDGSDSMGTGRQWTHPGHARPAVYQPTVQYFYINQLHNVPATSEGAGLLPRAWQRHFWPYYDSPVEGIGSADEEEASFRQFNLLGGIFNSRFSNGNTNLNTFRPIQNRVPLFVQNPDASTLYGPCDAGTGEKGICVPNYACQLYGGKSSGTCRFGSVCCVNTVTRCAATVTLNNTYYQSPPTQLTAPTSCTLTIKLDNRLKEQTQPVCQVRLDFTSFTLAQPNQVTSMCVTDTFQVGGALNPVPVICGDNDGQHMYVHVPPSSTNPGEVRLTINLGAGSTVARSWNMRISMLPCVSPSLAPADCLQYFTADSGKFWSFNWKDVAANTLRQLGAQNYKVCFRTEVVNSKRADRICFTECTLAINTADAFLVSGGTTTQTTGGANCAFDYIAITSLTPGVGVADRICGSVSGALLCTISKPFELYYRTDNTEANLDVTNQGFCFNFQQTPA